MAVLEPINREPLIEAGRARFEELKREPLRMAAAAALRALIESYPASDRSGLVLECELLAGRIDAERKEHQAIPGAAVELQIVELFSDTMDDDMLGQILWPEKMQTDRESVLTRIRKLRG